MHRTIAQTGYRGSDIGIRQAAKRESGHQHTNPEWLADLRGPRQREALTDLRSILLQGLRYAFASYGYIHDDDLEDFVQEALLRVLDRLDTFRGESRFTTWAQRIAVHIGLTELRRKRWKDISLDELTTDDTGTEFIPRFLAEPAADPERQAVRNSLLEHLRHVMAGELTERQRHALVAVGVYGMPTEETAHRMGTNRNALYKLLHDARIRLKERMRMQGTSAQEMLAFFAS